MEPPSYEEASRQPPAVSTGDFILHPPPSYHTPHSSPSTPPPSYGEAVTVPPDPFPVLTPPVVPTAVTCPQDTGTILHPITQIGVMPPVNSRQTPPVVQVAVTQPLPVPIQVTRLTNIPGLVGCPHCRQSVVTKVRHVPSATAWGMCLFIALMGFVCGFCLIPLMVNGLQDTHHSCPQCGAHLHTYRR